MILVTGARGVVGSPLCKTLGSKGQPFLSVSRSIGSVNAQIKTSTKTSNNASATTLQWDLSLPLSADKQGQIDACNELIHCAPIWLLPQHIPDLFLAGIRRIVVFSSTSVLSKTESQNPQEKFLVKQLLDSEASLNKQCDLLEISLTILRPSMIYGYGRDQNVSHIASFIRRYSLMFLVGKAKGLRQPVHADDLVDASLAILGKTNTHGESYNLAGQEVLSYRDLVVRIFEGLDRPVRIVSLPLAPFRWALKLASSLTSFSYTPEMADRMNQNLVYDISKAQLDFGYSPQAFLTQPSRDLVN